MKVLLIGFTKLAYMPYMNFYIDQVLKGDNEVHLLYWNRDLKEDIPLSPEIILHEFKFYQEDDVSKVKKIRSFIHYYNHAMKLVKSYKFDLIVVMHTIPAVLLYKMLIKKYRKKYIFDFRDLTYENNFMYRKIVHSLVNNSLMTFVSSDAFRDYLPSLNNIHTSHNILLDSMKFREVRRKENRNRKKIRIRFWGFIRHENKNKEFIDCIGNDDRFELHYHGREQEVAENLKRYCKEKNINNVYFNGTYYPEDRYTFASETDLIHNIYENDNTTDKAMGNKYYDGILFYIPQLCSLGSFMGELAKKNGVGFECNTSSTSFADDIYNYYIEIEWDKFNNNCDVEIDRILYEYKKGIDLIKKNTV